MSSESSSAAEASRRFSGSFDNEGRALVLVPQAGSGVTMYSNWPDELLGIPVLRYHIAGRDRRRAEQRPTHLRQICADLAASVLEAGGRDVVLIGHCMGALIVDATTSILSEQILARCVLSSMRPAHTGLYGAYDLSMSDTAMLQEMNHSLALSGRPNVHEVFEEFAVTILREDIQMLSAYTGTGREEDIARTILQWSADCYVPHSDSSYWAGYSRTQLIGMNGPPERFIHFSSEFSKVVFAGLENT